jgi:adenosylcobinamide kinase / adenosylcobinamide-phosphate guanylyltransferase
LITFLTGGARSGKSTLAVDLAGRGPGPVRLIATARADDEEMRARVAAHEKMRPADWTVVEEPIDLTGAISSSAPGETVIVDCVTLWIANLMLERDDARVFDLVEEAAATAAGRDGQTIVVSNEVGSGLVPMDPVGRRFRDLQGWANQRFAVLAERAFLVVSGRVLRLDDDVF